MFSHLPQLNNIRTFEAAARLGSFKAASDELNITPTAVSHQISNLESKLDILLFERKARSVTLTQEGVKLAQSAHQALQQLSSTLEDVSAIQSVLRITTTTSFASMWLVPNLVKFQTKHPEIQIEIKTGEGLDDLKKDRRVDLAIRYGCDDDADTPLTKLVTESFDAYATPSYFNHCKDLQAAKLIETRWKNKNLAPISWNQWLQKNNAEKPTSDIQYFDQEQHVIQAALAGQGIVLASSILVQMPLLQGWLTPYPGSYPLPGLSYYLLTSPFSQDLRKVLVFKEWIAGELSKKSLATG